MGQVKNITFGIENVGNKMPKSITFLNGNFIIKCINAIRVGIKTRRIL